MSKTPVKKKIYYWTSLRNQDPQNNYTVRLQSETDMKKLIKKAINEKYENL